MLTDAQPWPGTAARVTVGLTRMRAATAIESRRSSSTAVARTVLVRGVVQIDRVDMQFCLLAAPSPPGARRRVRDARLGDARRLCAGVGGGRGGKRSAFAIGKPAQLHRRSGLPDKR